jgi:hypothetical protein
LADVTVGADARAAFLPLAGTTGEPGSREPGSREAAARGLDAEIRNSRAPSAAEETEASRAIEEARARSLAQQQHRARGTALRSARVEAQRRAQGLKEAVASRAADVQRLREGAAGTGLDAPPRIACWICRRLFRTQAALVRHVGGSAMHAEKRAEAERAVGVA